MAFSFEPNIDALIVSAAQRHGIDPNAMRAIAQIESAGNPNAQNPRSSAGGLFQFIDATAGDYGLTNRFDPAQAADAGARLARDNASRLRGVLGREPTPGELYLAHQQGGGGAARLLRDPNARAVDIVGGDAIRLNGGSNDMTAGEFAALWTNKADSLVGGLPAGAVNNTTLPSGAASQAPQPEQTLQSRFQAAVQRATSGQVATDPARELTIQDRMANIGASLISMDQGGPALAPLQGTGGQIDLSNILNKARNSPIFNPPKGLSL